MNRIKLPLNEILIEDRQRQDLGNIPELAESLNRYGLIQPVVIDQSKRLIAGGRRCAAALHLGWKEIDVVYRETLSLDEAFELELEENVRRKDMLWWERCLNIEKIHQHKVLKAANGTEQWGQRETAALLGTSRTHVTYAVKMAELLKSPIGEQLKAEPDMASAWRLVLRLQQEQDEAYLRQQHDELTKSLPPSPEIVSLEEFVLSGIDIPGSDDAVKAAAKERYLSNPHNDPNLFDEYWAEKLARDAALANNVVNLSGRLFHEDSCDAKDSFMWQDHWRGRFNHVVTDIPYGIDMAHLDESMVDIETVADQHDVERNKALMARFFPAAFRVLQESGYCVTWCDQMNWDYMVDLAEKAGFSVQRWPLIWHKLHRCANKASQFNFTKNIELALVCRKGNAVLYQPAGSCVVTASNEDIRKLIPHPFAKPFEVWEFICSRICLPGQLVLDPFAGKGSGVLAMLQMNLNVIGVELVAEHYNFMLELIKGHYRKYDPNARFI